MKIAKQDHVDINKDGRIEPFEMHHFQDLWGVNRHETYPIFTIYDNNADGYLDELEYAHFLNDKIDKQHFYQHMRLAMVREAFETLDPKREDRELYDNEILYSIQEVIRKEGYCEGENGTRCAQGCFATACTRRCDTHLHLSPASPMKGRHPDKLSLRERVCV